MHFLFPAICSPSEGVYNMTLCSSEVELSTIRVRLSIPIVVRDAFNKVNLLVMG